MDISSSTVLILLMMMFMISVGVPNISLDLEPEMQWRSDAPLPRLNTTDQDSSTNQAQLPRHFPRTQAIDFVQPGQLLHHRDRSLHHAGGLEAREDTEAFRERPKRGESSGPSGRSVSRTNTHRTLRSGTGPYVGSVSRRTDVSFGGFPMPHHIVARIGAQIFSSAVDRIRRTRSTPTRTILPQPGGAPSTADRAVMTNLGMITAGTQSVPYISFDAVVGRNSQFHDLTEEELEELGGVEYRALKLLLWLVPVVSICRTEPCSRTYHLV